MFEDEVLVGKRFGAVDGGAACAVAVEEVAALDHEVFDLVRRCVSVLLCKLYAKNGSGYITTTWLAKVISNRGKRKRNICMLYISPPYLLNSSFSIFLFSKVC